MDVRTYIRDQKLCERPGVPAPNSPCGLRGRKATLNLNVTVSYSPCEKRAHRRDNYSMPAGLHTAISTSVYEAPSLPFFNFFLSRPSDLRESNIRR